MCEVSDGLIVIDHKEKCDYISDLSKDFLVVSEVGSKDENTDLPTDLWIELMQKELSAGSWKVIAEAREGGNVGIYNHDGGLKSQLIDEIATQINKNDILWEAPQKNQQVWFINKFGSNVNLGNISPDQAIPLECLRLGLRGDTFHNFLN